MWSVLGTGRCANFTRDQFTSNRASETFIKKYQAKPAHVNTTVYLDVIENPVEYQKLLWNVSVEGKKTKGICLWVYSSKHTEVLLASYVVMWRLDKLQRIFVSFIQRGQDKIKLHNMRKSMCWIVLWGYIKG